MRLRLLTILIVALNGCTTNTGVAPAERVITEPSEADFHFVGDWRPVQPKNVGAETRVMLIRYVGDGCYSVESAPKADPDFEIRFCVTEVIPNKLHAIVDIEVLDDHGNSMRRLVYASVQEDHLKVWAINSRRLAELLHEADVSAVIEHSLLSSTIRCDSEKLLAIVKGHPKDLLGEMQIFRRVNAEGGK